MSWSFSSTDSYPSPSGLHLIGACHLVQVDHIITCQQSKRRGGPKKATLQYDIIDASRGPGSASVLASHEIAWKTIAQKNFSNRANISQYQRNPFGAARIDAGADTHLMVVHGARSGKKGTGMSNTVGVNLDGRSLAQHPRFLLSSGKGESGARSTFLFYHINKHARVNLQRMWIEHRELKVTIEQLDEDEFDDNTAVPIVGFANKFKQVYAQKHGDDDSNTTTTTGSDVKMNNTATTTTTMPVANKRAASRWPPAVDMPMSRHAAPAAASSAAAHTLSALPPSDMPVALAERLLRRKRNYVDMLQAPVVDEPLPIDELCDFEARRCKQEKLNEDDAATNAAALFGGFDQTFTGTFQVDQCLDDMVTDEVLMSLESGGDTPFSTISEDAQTPRVDDITPPPAPFMHHSTDSAEHGGYDENELLMFEQNLEKYEAQCHHQQPAAASAAAGETITSELPLVLKTAHLVSHNPYHFTSFHPSPLSSPPLTSLGSGGVDLPQLRPFSLDALPSSAAYSPRPQLHLHLSTTMPIPAASPPPALFDADLSMQW